MSFRIMFDSVDPSAIPADAELVAGYVDGPKSVWPTNAWTMFPKAQLVRINVTGDPVNGGDVLDVETGDATPDHAPAWFDARGGDAAGLTIYCNRDTLPAVEQAMGKRRYFRWIATLDGTFVIPGYKPLEGPAAIQFAGAAQLGGRNVDMSLVMRDYFHPAPAAAAAPAGRTVADLRAKAEGQIADAGQLLSLLAKLGV